MKEKRRQTVLSYIFRVLLLIALVAVATAIGYLFSNIGFPETNIVLVYLLVVLIVACFSKGYSMGVVASITATLAFNYFFTSPYLSLSVDDPSYIITFVIMTITALIASTLTSRVKQNALQAIAKESEANTLYSLTNRLTDAIDIDTISNIAISSVSESFSCQAACIYFDEGNTLPITFIQSNSKGKPVRRKLQDGAELKAKMESLRTAYDIGPEFWDWPIYGGKSVLGIMRIPSENAELFAQSQIGLLQSMIESISLAMDRSQAALRQLKSHEETVQERYRANLLRAISHDLRTPLSGIIGTSEMLLNMTDSTDVRYPLIQGINKDADWLHSLVENILSLTKLQDGKLNLNKELEPVEEVVGGAALHIAKRYPEREVEVAVPEELLMVPMDAKLIEQVIVNLLDNAVQHTPPEREIKIEVSKDTVLQNAVFTISDGGSGISDEQLAVIFQAFYTSRSKMPDAKRGIGLGLTICEAIVKAHDGQIEARNRTDARGAEFIFKLPLEVKNCESISN